MARRNAIYGSFAALPLFLIRMQLLYIESSPRKDRSASIKVARAFAEEYMELIPGFIGMTEPKSIVICADPSPDAPGTRSASVPSLRRR